MVKRSKGGPKTCPNSGLDAILIGKTAQEGSEKGFRREYGTGERRRRDEVVHRTASGGSARLALKGS